MNIISATVLAGIDKGFGNAGLRTVKPDDASDGTDVVAFGAVKASGAAGDGVSGVVTEIISATVFDGIDNGSGKAGLSTVRPKDSGSRRSVIFGSPIWSSTSAGAGFAAVFACSGANEFGVVARNAAPIRRAAVNAASPQRTPLLFTRVWNSLKTRCRILAFREGGRSRRVLTLRSVAPALGSLCSGSLSMDSCNGPLASWPRLVASTC